MQTTIAVDPHSCASRPTIVGRASEAEAEPADLRRTDGAHEAGRGQGLQRSFGKGALLIDVGEPRARPSRCKPVPSAAE